LDLALSLRGPGPFRLPRPKQATAEKTAPDVVTLNVQVDDTSGEPPTVIFTELTPEEARTLAIRLWLAADE